MQSRSTMTHKKTNNRRDSDALKEGKVIQPTHPGGVLSQRALAVARMTGYRRGEWLGALQKADAEASDETWRCAVAWTEERARNGGKPPLNYFFQALKGAMGNEEAGMELEWPALPEEEKSLSGRYRHLTYH
ncbi:MAG: hypothetical protein AMJ38_02190 [Dehalococcoidia bacterium DG_22]|nr:MAG: hypothetical protein AMJ38_02190 [Dehalococcoidia bacterium DG_22]